MDSEPGNANDSAAVAAPERTCRTCGCTDTRACNPPCHWVDDDQGDRCSTCADIEAAVNGARFLRVRAENADGKLILRELLLDGEARDVVPPIGFSLSLGLHERPDLVLEVNVAGKRRTETIDLQPLVIQWVSAIAEELRTAVVEDLIRP